MNPFSAIEKANSALATTIKTQGGFVNMTQVGEIEKIDRFFPVLVRTGCGRFSCSAQYVSHYVHLIDSSPSDHVRDLSVQTGQ